MNCTTFADTSFDFVPGINAIVGASGTGKTHILKLLYSVQYACSRRRRVGNLLERTVTDVFSLCRSEEAAGIHSLIRQQPEHLSVGRGEGTFDNQFWGFAIHSPDKDFPQRVKPLVGFPRMPRPIFIPSMDMMVHTSHRASTFDLTQRDLVTLLISPKKRGDIPTGEISALLTRVSAGELEEEGKRFYLRTPHGRLPLPLVSEGLRKIATLYQLLRNGYLGPGETLFWDGPEVSLDSFLIGPVVEALLSLARSGVQIFLAARSPIILKELDLRANSTDSMRYFRLSSTPEGTQVETAGTYGVQTTNATTMPFDSRHDGELTRTVDKRRD